MRFYYSFQVHIVCYSRWNRFAAQFSEPIYLEAGQPYYFEVLSNNHGFPWDVGLGVKLHNSTLSGGLYESDREMQRVAITSSIVKEQHVREMPLILLAIIIIAIIHSMWVLNSPS